MPFPADWIVPDWPVPANVRAVCTTRAGGVSVAPYDSLNLGDHVGDAAQAVARNRALLRESVGARPVFLRQVHGLDSVRITARTPDGTTADACVTTVRGVACTIMVADCLPMLFATHDGRAVAAGHAGWRGLAGKGGRGIVEALWDCLRENAGVSQPRDVSVWLGPCIGPEKFEVGPEVKAAFEHAHPAAAAHFAPYTPGKWLADLPGLARLRLQRAGIESIHGNDGSRGWCTVSNPSRFFSHRRDRVSGRMAACVWLA